MEKNEIVIPILTADVIQEAVEKALKKYFSNNPIDDCRAERNSKPLSMEEACKFLGISKPTMYNWISKGIIRVSRINGRIFFTEESLIGVIKENELSNKQALRLKS